MTMVEKSHKFQHEKSSETRITLHSSMTLNPILNTILTQEYFTFVVHGIEVDRTTAKRQQSTQTVGVVAGNGQMQTV